MNERIPFHDLQSFLAVAEIGSFRGAARELGVSPSAVSHSVRSLEQWLGVRVLHRTTRSVAPTPEGQELLDATRPLVASLQAALESAAAGGASVRGTLRISAPRIGARTVLLPVVRRLMARHPQVHVEISSDDAVRDLVAEGFDAGVRFSGAIEADLIARPLGPPQRFVVVGSPAYLAAHGAPHHPDDLREHRCIRLQFPSGRAFRWEFRRGETSLDVAVEGSLTVVDVELGTDAARAGLGLAWTYAHSVAQDLERGTLVEVLADWRPEEPGFHLIYPSRKLQRPVMRALLDVIADTPDGA